jgi:hypothetical protein
MHRYGLLQGLKQCRCPSGLGGEDEGLQPACATHPTLPYPTDVVIPRFTAPSAIIRPSTLHNSAEYVKYCLPSCIQYDGSTKDAAYRGEERLVYSMLPSPRPGAITRSPARLGETLYVTVTFATPEFERQANGQWFSRKLISETAGTDLRAVSGLPYAEKMQCPEHELKLVVTIGIFTPLRLWPLTAFQCLLQGSATTPAASNRKL